MRFMMIVKASPESEAGALPPPEEFAAMQRYNEELVRAGVLLAAEGVQPSSKGKRVTFSGGKPTVTDGPFTETKELVAGFWLIEVRSAEEALEWATRVPFQNGEVEVRPVFADDDFAGAMDPATAQRQVELRREVESRNTRS